MRDYTSADDVGDEEQVMRLPVSVIGRLIAESDCPEFRILFQIRTST
jgi:hypothetical protein